ncbi:hypothetical protein BpHYR1_022523 [Brachionus plicatilis]|uniref:Uncharacterized protein n=1 Tax=Brachionus plicatilis TaxID=10195 RepID=A0A3M7RN17_BRAPC|nr:hypothetical protein BpHYR1_022523 [Brachionus plicatilis]
MCMSIVMIAFVDGIVNWFDVVEAMGMHVAAVFAQNVDHRRVIGADCKHERCIAIFIFNLKISAVLNQNFNKLRKSILDKKITV